MKFCVFFIIALIVIAQALTPEEKEDVKKHYKQCYEDTGADRELTKRAKDGDFEFEDEKVKDWFYCMMRKVGIMDDEGNFLRDAAIQKVPESERDDVARALDACLGNKGDTGSQSAWNYAKCYNKERPGQEDFF